MVMSEVIFMGIEIFMFVQGLERVSGFKIFRVVVSVQVHCFRLFGGESVSRVSGKGASALVGVY
jgi:hypothetical protein